MEDIYNALISLTTVLEEIRDILKEAMTSDKSFYQDEVLKNEKERIEASRQNWVESGQDISKWKPY